MREREPFDDFHDALEKHGWQHGVLTQYVHPDYPGHYIHQSYGSLSFNHYHKSFPHGCHNVPFKDSDTYLADFNEKERKKKNEEYLNNTVSTQVATTGGTYKKSGEFLKKHLPQGSIILNGGAGLDHTGTALKAGLGNGYHVHDYEPNPQRRKTPPKFTHDTEIPTNHAHGQVWMNVHNVVEPHVREHIYNHLFRTTKEGGHILIGTRGWHGDIANNKNYEPGEEPKSMWVKKAKGQTSYQKGYDGDDLKNEVEAHAQRLGHTVKVTKVGGLAKSAVHIHLIKKRNKMEDSYYTKVTQKMLHEGASSPSRNYEWTGNSNSMNENDLHNTLKKHGWVWTPRRGENYWTHPNHPNHQIHTTFGGMIHYKPTGSKNMNNAYTPIGVERSGASQYLKKFHSYSEAMDRDSDKYRRYRAQDTVLLQRKHIVNEPEHGFFMGDTVQLKDGSKYRLTNKRGKTLLYGKRIHEGSSNSWFGKENDEIKEKLKRYGWKPKSSVGASDFYIHPKKSGKMQIDRKNGALFHDMKLVPLAKIDKYLEMLHEEWKEPKSFYSRTKASHEALHKHGWKRVPGKETTYRHLDHKGHEIRLDDTHAVHTFDGKTRPIQQDMLNPYLSKFHGGFSENHDMDVHNVKKALESKGWTQKRANVFVHPDKPWHTVVMWVENLQ